MCQRQKRGSQILLRCQRGKRAREMLMSGLGVLLSKYNHSLFLSTLHKVAGARNKGSDQKKSTYEGTNKSQVTQPSRPPRISAPTREGGGAGTSCKGEGWPAEGKGRASERAWTWGSGRERAGPAPLSRKTLPALAPRPPALPASLPSAPLPPGTQAALTWAPPPGTGGQWEEEGDTSKSLSSSASPTVLGKLQGPGGGHGCSMSRWPGPDNRHRQPPRRE